jgi:hypothetical protein
MRALHRRAGKPVPGTLTGPLQNQKTYHRFRAASAFIVKWLAQLQAPKEA